MARHLYSELSAAARPKASRIENGVEICNTCVRPVDQPFRYKDSQGRERGCVSKCHDVHVRHNTKPNWMAPRYVMPKWITDCRRTIQQIEQVAKGEIS